MKPAPFDYLAPRNVPEALDVLARHGAEARVLAGGQSLVPLMNFRLARPALLVDVNRLDELAGVSVVDDRLLVVGALTRQSDAARHPAARARVPLLAEAISYIGHPAIQHRGTVGGSLAHADPAAELTVAALVLDAELRARRVDRARMLAAEDFWLGYLTTALEPYELLTAAAFPIPPAGTGWCFTEVARRHGDFALVAVAALLGLDPSGRVSLARLALGGVAPAPMRAHEAERLLLGEAPTEDAFRAAAAAASAAVEPESDLHASAEYRRHLAGVLVRRALATALSRAGRRSHA